MEENFNCAAHMDDDQEGEWREILQKWDEQGLNNMINEHSNGLAMDSLNPNSFYPNPHYSASSMGSLNPLTMGVNSSLININPSLISTNQQNSGTTQPLMGLEAVLNDALDSSVTSLHTINDADNLMSTVRQPEEISSSNLKSSWLSTFLQSLQSHPAASSSQNNFLTLSSEHNPVLASPPPPSPSPHGTARQFNSDLQQTGSSLDDILEQMSNEFIHHGAAGSLQEQLSNALSASNVNLMMGSASMSTVMGRGGGSASNENIAAAQMFSTPASSVSSDGGPDDDSSSHEDMSNALDQLDDFMMQSSGPSSQPKNVSNATPLPSSDATSSQVGTKAETSVGPNPNDQEQLKKRVSKSGRVTKKPKRERGEKLAIKIQSDVEVLDDGYKWRKYGQKPVKNSPYPRSYYKCTDKQCKVKKHVERQAQEPEFVVTTYEGVHNHSRPDQQLQALHSQSDVTSHQHDSFQPFVPTPHSHTLSPMELLGLRPSSLFPVDSQPMSLPLQQGIANTQNALESLDQGILQTLLQGEPRTSSI